MEEWTKRARTHTQTHTHTHSHTHTHTHAHAWLHTHMQETHTHSIILSFYCFAGTRAHLKRVPGSILSHYTMQSPDSVDQEEDAFAC